MGTWKLEVFKMAIYLGMPVIFFHIFNQPTYFEEWVINTKRMMYPPENEEYNRMYRETVAELRKKETEALVNALEAFEKNKQ